MRTLIAFLIFAGSALMVYNIIRYGMFVKKARDLEQNNRTTGALLVPLLLLIFFLIGYLVVGFSGTADLMMAAILFGGSIFVFLLLLVIYSIVDRIMETDEVLSARYEEMVDEVEALSQDALSSFRVNLTRDEIENRAGGGLYETDLNCVRYSELLEKRSAYLFDRREESGTPFSREGLLEAYHEGRDSVSETVLVRRPDGKVGFSTWSADLRKMPVSGDVIGFLVERACDDQIVSKVLLERVLTSHYERIAYLIDGVQTVMIGSGEGRGDCALLPPEPEDSYESLYLNYMLPAMRWDRASGKANPLRLSVIDRALAENDFYEVDAVFELDGALRRKQLSFYCVDRKAKYYLMLVSDVAAVSPAVPEEPEPEKPAPAPEPEEPEAPEEPEETGGALLEGLRVLLADDNEMNREIGEMLLSAEGAEVVLARDGAEAASLVEQSAERPFDLVLMDVQMPVLNGYEATARIRALSDPALAGVPIVAMTANTDPESAAEALAAGMDGFGSKPIDPPRIRETYDRILAERK